MCKIRFLSIPRIKKMAISPFYYLIYLFSHEKHAKMLGVNMGENCRVYGRISWGTEPWIITLGNNVHISAECRFVTHDGATLLFRHRDPLLELTKPIIVGSNVYIGTRTMVLGGVTIGDNVIIGAGSIVTKNIPSNSVAVGVPARVIKSTEDYYNKAKKESIGLGDLKYSRKTKALKKYYKYKKG